MVESKDPVMMSRSSYCKHSTEPVCPCSVLTHCMLLLCQICTSNHQNTSCVHTHTHYEWTPSVLKHDPMRSLTHNTCSPYTVHVDVMMVTGTHESPWLCCLWNHWQSFDHHTAGSRPLCCSHCDTRFWSECACHSASLLPCSEKKDNWCFKSNNNSH